MESVPADALQKAGKICFASIGPITSKTLEEYGLKADIEPKDYTIPALLAEITKYFSKETDIHSPYYQSLLNAAKQEKL